MRSYSATRAACYLGYVAQAVVNNLAPLLFLLFEREFGVTLGQLSAYIAVNFGVQLLVDLLSARIVGKIGCRACLVAAHFFAAVGLGGLSLFPRLMPPFAGLLFSAVFSAVGGGLIEVLVSPVVEALPAKNKSAQMSLLHSFYCWGSAAVILFSTLFLFGFGGEKWGILPPLWAALPLANGVFFCFVPLCKLVEGERLPMRELLGNKSFRIFALLMTGAGAAELCMSQWASAFAESGLNVDKTLGDLFGPCLFAVLMGCSRTLYSLLGGKLRLFPAIVGSGILCVACYLTAGLSSLPALSLAGCALCGFSVGLFWPGVYSLAAEKLPRGGEAMFAFLALAGDAGCLLGPTLVGAVVGVVGGGLQTALLVGTAFPVLIVAVLLSARRKTK